MQGEALWDERDDSEGKEDVGDEVDRFIRDEERGYASRGSRA